MLPPSSSSEGVLPTRHYLTLEQLDPEDPAWAKRAGDCYLRLGRKREQVAGLC